MLSGGKVVVLLVLQYSAKNIVLLVQKFLGEIFMSKSVFGYLKLKKVKKKSSGGH